MLAVALLFVSFAMPAALLGVMWPEIRVRFGQSLGTLGLVGFAYGATRMATCSSARFFTRRFGMHRSVIGASTGLVLACGALAAAQSWNGFLVAVAAVGMASGALDSLGASFITRLGDITRAGLIHGSYGVGATIAPLVAGITGNWRVTMAVVALWGVGVLGLVMSTRAGWPGEGSHHDEPAHNGANLAAGAVVLTLSLYAVFVGLEVTVGTWSHTYLTDQRGLSGRVASLGVSAFWGGITLGRLSLSRPAVARMVSRLTLPAFAVAALAFLASLTFVPAAAGVVVLLLVGLSLAPVIPSLLASTARRLGARHAERMAGYQLIAANVGAIGGPSITGALVAGSGPGIVLVVALALSMAGVVLLSGTGGSGPNRPVTGP